MKIVKQDADLPVECVAEVVPPEDGEYLPWALIQARAEQQAAEKLRVVEKNVHDYVWNDRERGFYPVFGSVHGQAELDRNKSPRRVVASVTDVTAKPKRLTFVQKLLGKDK